MSETEKLWTDKVADKLVGRTVTGVRYATEKECAEMGWYSRPVILILDDGSYIFPMADDEGNDGGAMATSHDDLTTIPVLR